MAINEAKYENAILYFVSQVKSSTLGKVKLMKLLYYLDFDHFEQFNDSVTGDEYLRWDMGPVPASAEAVITTMVNEGKLQVKEQNIGLPNLWTKYTTLQEYDVQVFSSIELETLHVVAEKWNYHSGREMINAVHGEPPWLETAPYEVIDYRLALKRSGKDSESLEVEQMNEKISAEDRKEREKTLQLAARLEHLVRTDDKFSRWLQRGYDQVEKGQVIALAEGSWEEVQ